MFAVYVKNNKIHFLFEFFNSFTFYFEKTDFILILIFFALKLTVALNR